MPKEHRLAFLVIEAEPAQGLSTRKLLLESAKHNVVTAYSPQEGLAMFRRFPNVDAVAIARTKSLSQTGGEVGHFAREPKT